MQLVSAVEARLHEGRQALSAVISKANTVQKEAAGLRASLVKFEAERAGFKTQLAAAEEECEIVKKQLLQEELHRTK